MDIIFSDSLVLKSFVDNLSPAFLSSNRHLLANAIKYEKQWNLIVDKQNNQNIDFVEFGNHDDLMNIIKILHEYNVSTYYKKIINQYITFLLSGIIVYQPDSFCDDIILDILHANQYYFGILSYLMGFCTVLWINDYIFLHEFNCNMVNTGMLNTDLVAEYCLLNGNKIIQVLRDTNVFIGYCRDLCGSMAKYGNLELLDICYKNNDYDNANNDHKNNANNDHENNAKLLVKINYVILLNASKYGHQHILDWALVHNIKLNFIVYVYAAFGGHLSIIKWMRTLGIDWGWGFGDLLLWDSIYDEKQDDKIHFYIRMGLKITSTIGYAAALGGNLHILDFLRENGLNIDDAACSGAVEGNHIEILEWCLDHNCEITRVAVDYAKKKNSEIFNWLQARQIKPINFSDAMLWYGGDA